jgi:hypothetical protein
MLKTPLDLYIFKFISFLDLILKLPKLDYPESEIGRSGFLRLAKFGHQRLCCTLDFVNLFCKRAISIIIVIAEDYVTT